MKSATSRLCPLFVILLVCSMSAATLHTDIHACNCRIKFKVFVFKFFLTWLQCKPVDFRLGCIAQVIHFQPVIDSIVHWSGRWMSDVVFSEDLNSTIQSTNRDFGPLVQWNLPIDTAVTAQQCTVCFLHTDTERAYLQQTLWSCFCKDRVLWSRLQLQSRIGWRWKQLCKCVCVSASGESITYCKSNLAQQCALLHSYTPADIYSLQL